MNKIAATEGPIKIMKTEKLRPNPFVSSCVL